MTSTWEEDNSMPIPYIPQNSHPPNHCFATKMM